MKIILIGNAEFKKEEKFGSLIDEFEVVVRINRFRLETFEENLGTKTNIWALNRTLPFNRASVPFQFQKEFLVRKKISQDLDYGLMISYMPNGNEYSKVLNSVKQIDNLQLANTMVQSDYVRQKWKTLVKEPFYKPATGIMSILYFIEKFESRRRPRRSKIKKIHRKNQEPEFFKVNQKMKKTIENTGFPCIFGKNRLVFLIFGLP